MMLDQLGTVGVVSGDSSRPDNIVFDITQTGNFAILTSKRRSATARAASVHPTCLNNPNPRHSEGTPESPSRSGIALGSGAEPLRAGSTEDDVEGTGESARFPRGTQRHDEPGAGGGITHAHQHAVALV